MTAMFDSKPVPNRLTAKRIHAELQARDVSHFELGQFYRAMLAQQLWKSQRDMADFLVVSNANISRLIALTRIPDTVVVALGGRQRITFRVGELLLEMLDKLGEKEVSARAREASALGYGSVDDVLEFLVNNRKPVRTLSTVRVRLARDKQTLRVEIPQLGRLLPHLSKLESFLSTALLMFEATLESEAAAAKLTRYDQLRGAIDALGAQAPDIESAGGNGVGPALFREQSN
ncbi:hypothetical protein M3A49_35330 [Paraburkholderia sp. CNPSo 3076]|uniref:hypothetical protein n=1 Tax=Paraburkholderia sp. CNPSo 3076 TaxID=2940936 RepID=UPI00224FBBD6|nr:hypothetical protein [Paraburkholderia sp. CNPSo 3076]MCX5544679.1 hypothetical protein [Paraburkholderia sp. CNPSo 3076]